MSQSADKFINPLTDFAEIAKFSEKERKEYEKSLKIYRDIKNVVDTARTEGKMEGRIEGKIEGKTEVAKSLKKNGVSIDLIMESTGLSKVEIEKL